MEFEELSTELQALITQWAETSLDGIGLIKRDSPEYDRLKYQAIGQLRALYSDKTIELFLGAKDNKKLDSPDGYAKVDGECGDVMEIFLKIDKEQGAVIDSSFQTNGCAPSVASGGMVTEMVKGKHIDEIKKYTQKDVLESMGGLPEESQHCAMLAIYTLKEAIEDFYKKNT